MKIDQKLISRLEELAKLELSQTEREHLRKDLNEILEMVEKLLELETESIEPLVYVSPEVNALREDEVENQLSREQALLNAPKKDDQFFKVPKVIDIQKK